MTVGLLLNNNRKKYKFVGYGKAIDKLELYTQQNIFYKNGGQMKDVSYKHKHKLFPPNRRILN